MSKVRCSLCGKEFRREQGRYNEAKKNGWNQYCSLDCQYKSKLRRVKNICANPKCKKLVSRQLNEFQKSKSGLMFCSHSCSASVTNFRRRKLKTRLTKIKTCPVCNKEFWGERKYCSSKCRPKPPGFSPGFQRINKEQIIDDIKSFYKRTKRIPVKREFSHYHAVQRRFGTWNNAVKAAGFDPNPVKFAKKYLANDSHKCDSLSEKIIDDWLYARNIPHETNFPYGKDKMTADFKVNNVLIEFLGLRRELKAYDRMLVKKKKLWKKRKMKVIEIFPEDLFPNSRPDVVLNPLF